MTEAEFVAWADEDTNAEWVDGEVQYKMPSHEDHDELQRILAGAIDLLAKRRALGKVRGADFTVRLILAGGRVVRREPDVFFVSKARQSLLQPTLLEGAPDLVVEVVSPESQGRDYRQKYLEYEEVRVREYWIVNPIIEQVEVHQLDTKSKKFVPLDAVRGKLTSKVLPGFVLKPATLFKKPIPDIVTFVKSMGVKL